MSLPWLSDPRRPLTSPREIPKLEAWFDALDTRTMLAGDGTTITDGGAVALWGDKSGNSGVNCLVLNAVAGNYASFTALTAVGTGNFTISAKVRINSLATASAIIGGAAASPSFRVEIDTGKIYIAKTGTGNGTVSTVALVAYAEYVIGYSRNGTTGTYYINGVAAGTTTDSFDYTVGFTEIGSVSAGATANANANISWVRTYSAALDASAMAADAAGTVQANNVFNCDFSTSPKKLANGDTFVCATGQTVTLNSSGATGARIAGERDLFQGTAANRPIFLQYAGTKYGYLNGTAGNYFSTPDNVAVGVTGANELRCSFTPSTMTPSSNVGLVAKWSSTGDQRSFGCSFTTTSALVYLRTANGIDTETATSSATLASVGFAANQLCHVKVTHDTATGTVKFYYSADGSSYTQLGTDRSVTAGANYDGTGIVTVGILDPSPSQLFTGRIYRAQIYSGVGGTLAADFNPALYTSGTTFTASTGEVWTINGGAHIVTRTGLYFDGSNDYLVSAALSVAQPYTLYPVLAQLTWTSTDRLVDVGGAYFYQKTSTPTVSLVNGPTTDGLALKTTGILSGVANGASSTIRYNRQTAAKGDAGAIAATAIAVGAAPNSFLPANVFVSELGFYSAAHSAATQDRMAIYSGRRHGFAV